MRGVIVLMAVMSVVPIDAAHPIDATKLCTARQRAELEPTVTIQIHDYAHVPGGWLSSATDIVTRIYRANGIRIEWHEVLQHGKRRKKSDKEEERTTNTPIAQVSLMILTPEMAARGRIPTDVLGYAAVPHDGGMGRIAYVIYDRIQRIAASGRPNEVELLAFVMAHETGHLLLGRGSGTESGLMKCHWDFRGIQQLDARKLEFSELQAGRIRNALMNDPRSPAMLARAETGMVETSTADACASATSAEK